MDTCVLGFDLLLLPKLSKKGQEKHSTHARMIRKKLSPPSGRLPYARPDSLLFHLLPETSILSGNDDDDPQIDDGGEFGDDDY